MSNLSILIKVLLISKSLGSENAQLIQVMGNIDNSDEMMIIIMMILMIIISIIVIIKIIIINNNNNNSR